MEYDIMVVNNPEDSVFTQTHVLVGAAIFARPGRQSVALAGLLGALAPDSDVWTMFIVERLRGASGCEVFHYRYWEPPWTTLQVLLNSIPGYLALVALGLGVMFAFGSRSNRVSMIVIAFSGSALLHVGFDFLLHHDDARAQWMPFTDWVFRSPVSYWDPDHYGRIFIVFEIVLGLSLAALVGLRFRKRWVWIAVGLLSLGYVGAFAVGQVSGADHVRGPGSCDVLEQRDIPEFAPPPNMSRMKVRSHAHV